MASKRLVTESDVRAMVRGGDLVLGPDVIAFQRGMKLSRRDGGAAGAGSWR